MNKETFEEKMNRLEYVAEKMQDDVSLQESVKLYEDGVKLLKELSEELNKAEEKVKKLTLEAGKIKFEDYE